MSCFPDKLKKKSCSNKTANNVGLERKLMSKKSKKEEKGVAKGVLGEVNVTMKT